MGYFLQYCAVQTVIFVLNLLPFPVSRRFAKWVGGLFYFFASKRRKIALDNIENAYGDTLSPARKKNIALKSFKNTALSILDLLLIKKIKKTAKENFSITGVENLHNALSHGKGVVLITSHLGSWECLEFLFYLTQTQCSVIVKSIKNPYLDKKIDALRRETTVIPIPKKNAIREALSKLKQNQIIAVLIDQWAGKDGLWIDFFGTFTSTTSLPARLAKKTGCLLLPAYCLRRDKGKFEIQVLPHVPLPGPGEEWENNVTQKLNEMLEVHIRRYPEQWSWAHRRWKTKPATSRQT